MAEASVGNSLNSNIWKAYVLQFLMSLHFIGGVLVPFFLDWGNISYFQIMILQFWFVVCCFVLEIPTGVIADHFNRKTSIVLACLLNAMAAFVYTSKPNFLIFVFGEFVWAFGHALFSGAYEAFVYDTLKASGQENRSKKIFGRFKSFHMAGIMFAAPIGSMIAVCLGLRWTMLLMAIPLMLAFFLGLTLKEPKKEKASECLTYFQRMSEGIKYFCYHKKLRYLALDGVVVMTMCFFLVWTYQLVLKQLGVDLVYFGIIHALLSGAQIIVMNNFERLEKFFGSKSRYLFFSALISGIGFVFLGVNVYVIPTILGILIVSGFGLSRFTLISSYMQKHIESHNRATVLSVVAMFRGICMAICYPLVGLLVEWSLNYTLVILGLVIVVVSLVFKTDEADLID